jgi:hypothetical protein
MTDSPLHPATKCSAPTEQFDHSTTSLYHSMALELLEPQLRTFLLGTCEYIPNTLTHTPKGRTMMWECLQCGKVQQKWLHNMLAGRGNACLCQRNRKHPYGCAVSQILMRRYTAAKERCKPRGANSKYYGQRGIEMRFKDSREYIDEILRVYPHLTAEELDYLQVDRIDNSGHYEPGNIRLVTLRENLLNRRAYTTSSTRGRAGDSQCRDS